MSPERKAWNKQGNKLNTWWNVQPDEYFLHQVSINNNNNITSIALKDEETFANKHELLQYSVRTINKSKASRITYPHKMHAFYEERV